MNDDEMKLYRAFMAAQLQAAPKKTPDQEAADYAVMQQAPYQYGEGHQNINAALLVDYHTARRLAATRRPTGWQRLKAWLGWLP